jgi:hypothetical protein
MRLTLEGFPDILHATPGDVAHAVLHMWRPKGPTCMTIEDGDVNDAQAAGTDERYVIEPRSVFGEGSRHFRVCLRSELCPTLRQTTRTGPRLIHDWAATAVRQPSGSSISCCSRVAAGHGVWNTGFLEGGGRPQGPITDGLHGFDHPLPGKLTELDCHGMAFRDDSGAERGCSPACLHAASPPWPCERELERLRRRSSSGGGRLSRGALPPSASDSTHRPRSRRGSCHGSPTR